MGTSWHNVNGKIWIFVDAEIQVEIMRDTEQLLSCRFTHLGDGQELVLTVVYASTDRNGRIALWEDLYDMSSHITIPWLVGGDFNVITDDIEKFGGLPVQFAETEDFRQCIDICQLMDLGFTGSMFTWWNGRSDEACIFKRLDRCLGNQALQNSFPNLEVEHLIKQGSDHSPLLVNMRADSRPIRKSFRFLNFWVEHESFLDVIKENWVESYGSDPFFNFHNKLKKMGRALSKWSRDTYGDIFKQIATLEEVVQVHEQEFEQNPTGLNRERLQRVQADLIRKLQLQRIQDHTSTWLDTEEEIAQEAIRFFSDQFKEENIPTDFSMLDKIPKMVTEEQNQQLYEMPDEAEVKRAVFGLNGDSAGGPDGFTGRCFQACWEIIANDLVTMQSGFVKGKSIVENILLAQEIVHDIRIRGKPANVVIKLDMEKAYDRIPKKDFPFTYLGVPIYYGRRRNIHYKEIIEKIQNRLSSWTGKLLSIGGRTTLIKHVLPSMPIHLLSACDPPSAILAQIHRLFAKFFWSNSVGNSNFECDPTIILVKETAEVGQWDEQLLRRILPEDLADHIVQHINPPNENGQADKAFWKLDSRGKFTVGSAFQLLRQRKDPSNLYKQMWIKGLPIKISFFMWRFWKFKLPLDDKLKKWGHQFPSRCYCCQHPKVEDTSHVFLHSPTAQAIWKYFCGPVGINTENLQSKDQQPSDCSLCNSSIQASEYCQQNAFVRTSSLQYELSVQEMKNLSQ
ncbi:uncharacterized protein LOC132631084 [Lycium barbarum]|uniref:uncharacterized protein LOC132631084 n=1 Tax=Lycium barbarum TaxID=112863 RepID=UPI00293EBFF1|nr:uncharacterized protein LOC132631084 [Lycium barbarum]